RRRPIYLWLDPNFLIAGNQSTGTVALGVPAPPGGAVVPLSSSNPAIASVPASVTVAGGATTATFTVSTSPVGANTMVTITAAYGGETRYLSLQLVPSTLSALTLNPKTVAAGSSST